MGHRRERADEAGFTVVELLLSLLLFSMLSYATISMMTVAITTMTRLMGEYDSRQSVMMLQREMAEGTRSYGGYLAASDIRYGPSNGECVFEILVFGREVRYAWRPQDETIRQSVDGGPPVTLLTDVAGFSVTRSDQTTLRVEITHRVLGYLQPIARATEGQPRNMKLANAVLEDCP